MKAEDIKLGMEVFVDGDRCYTAIVKSLPDEQGCVEIKWRSTSKTDNFSCRYLSAVDPAQDKKAAAEIQKRLDEAATNFELAFLAFQEAQEIAASYTIQIHQLKDAGLLSIKGLEDVLDNNGWRSSSLWC